MSKDDMVQARELIKQKRFDEARAILQKTDHHQAADWLAKLEEIDPLVTDPEATLIEKTPQFTGHVLPPPMTGPDSRPAHNEEREIPMPLAIGIIGLIILAAVCVIGALLIYNNMTP